MTGLDIQGLARTAASIGFGLAGNAKVSITVNLANAAGTYDPATDGFTGATVTAVTLDAIEYQRRNFQDRQTSLNDPAGDRNMDTNTKTFLVQAADLPAGKEITQRDTITAGGSTWGITNVIQDPGRAAWIVDVSRQ